MLKRLTDATSYCARINCLAGRPGSGLCAARTCYPRELYERLRYYEDLEEADLAGHAEIVVHCADCKYYLPVNGDCGVCDLQGRCPGIVLNAVMRRDTDEL